MPVCGSCTTELSTSRLSGVQGVICWCGSGSGVFWERVHGLTCFQESECFPSPELFQSKVSHLLGEENNNNNSSSNNNNKNKGSLWEHTATSSQNKFLARLSCLLILKFRWFARSRASVLEREVSPRSSSYLPPSVLHREEGDSCISKIPGTSPLRLRELQTLKMQLNSAQRPPVKVVVVWHSTFSRQELSSSSWCSANAPLFLLWCKNTNFCFSLPLSTDLTYSNSISP